MSSYFDERTNQVRVFREQGLGPWHDAVRAFAEDLLFDLTLCAEFDRGPRVETPWTFPPDLRDTIYTLIVSHWSEAWPPSVPGYGVDYGEDEEGMQKLGALLAQLHDLFHEAARRGWAGMDNPQAVRGELRSRRDGRAETLIAETPSLQLDADLRAGHSVERE